MFGLSPNWQMLAAAKILTDFELEPFEQNKTQVIFGELFPNWKRFKLQRKMVKSYVA